MLNLSYRASLLQSSVSTMLAHKLRDYKGKLYPFHVGNCCLEPPVTVSIAELNTKQIELPYHYGYTQGELAFRQALAQKVRLYNQMVWATAENIQVTTGATNAITCAIQALTDPGDEVLMLSPYWSLMRGIVHCAGSVPVEVPFYQQLLDYPDTNPADIITPYLTPRTRLIYLISPNNPNGLVLTASQLNAVARFAQHHNLWVISDEAYEAYIYVGSHISIATLDDMAERTISVYTFSKTFALAGLRVGYLVAPEWAIDAIRKIATHTIYNTAQVCQVTALQALEIGEKFVAHAHKVYQEAARLVSTHLEASFHPAQGGAYVFIDLRKYGSNSMPVLEKAIESGITLAPGEIFGQGFEGFARLCFTSVDHETLVEGIEQLNQVLSEIS
jgi:aspartate/methionine/tyrosine aminotransferase